MNVRVKRNIITIAVSVLVAVALCMVPVAADSGDSQGSTPVTLYMTELTINVDSTIAGWGYQVKYDNVIEEHTDTQCKVVIGKEKTVQILVRPGQGLPTGWYLTADAVNCSYTIPENENLVKVDGFTGSSAGVTITADKSGYTAHITDYTYCDAASTSRWITPDVPPGSSVVYYYSYTSNGDTKIPWSTENGNTLNAGTYYILATVDNVETARSAFNVIKAPGIMPAVPIVTVSNMPVMVTLDASDKHRDLQYSIDGGSTWVDLLSAEEDAGYFSIPGLQRSTEYTLLLKASATSNFEESSPRSVTFTTADLTPVYKVKYNANGGMNTPDDISFKEGESYTIDDGSSVYRAGYTFAGWYTAMTGGSKVSGTIKVTRNLNLYAHWTLTDFTVYFDANGGSGSMSPVTTDVNTEITLPANTFVNGNKIFAGWAVYPAAHMLYHDQYTGKLIPDAATNTLTLYAVWDDSLRTVQVAVTNGIDGTAVTIELKKGNVVEDRKTATVTGGTASAVFTGVDDGVYNLVITHGDTVVTRLITIPDSLSYSVELPESGVNSKVEVKEHTPQTVVGNLEKEAESNRETGKEVTVTLTVEAQQEMENYEGDSEEKAVQVAIQDIALVANKNGSAYLEYLTLDVTKKVTDGSGTVEQKITVTDNVLEIVIPFDCTDKLDIKVYRKHGDSVSVLDRIYGKPGTEDGTYYIDTANNLIYLYSNKFSVYAIGWTESGVVTHTITFDAAGGSGTMSSVTVFDEGWIVLPPCTFTAPDGKEFDCWMVNGVLMYPGDTLTPAADVTVYAVWKPLGTWKVSFDANGGTGLMDSVYVEKGTTLVMPGCTFGAPSGKVFSSWRIGSRYYNPGDSFTPSADVTAYAVWKSTGGGSGSGSSAVTYCLVQFETFDTAVTIEDQWLREGSLVQKPADPSEEGFVFGGWYTEEGIEWNFATDKVYYSMTLYAKWIPSEDRPTVNPVEPVTPVETPVPVIGVLAGLLGAGAAVMIKRRK